MENPFASFMEDETQGMFFQNGLHILASIDPEKIEHAIERISRETTMGPLTDPTAYLDGKLFDSATTYTEVFKLALPLVKKLQEMKEGL